jgi:hypothetical protein
MLKREQFGLWIGSLLGKSKIPFREVESREQNELKMVYLINNLGLNQNRWVI